MLFRPDDDEPKFCCRSEAGRLLVLGLAEYANRHDVVVLGMARGGIPVAFQIAQALNAPLDAFVMRDLPVPGRDDLAMGTAASGGVLTVIPEVVDALQIPNYIVEEVASREEYEVHEREEHYHHGRGLIEVADKTVILADDGSTDREHLRRAVDALRALGPAKIVLALPVTDHTSCEQLSHAADEVVTIVEPEPMAGISEWYEQFWPVDDAEVRRLLEQAAGVLDEAELIGST